jgi:hypothetical protein
MVKTGRKWAKTAGKQAKTMFLGEKWARVPEAIATGGFSKKGYALV